MKRILKYHFSLLNVDYVSLGARWDYRNVISPYYRLYFIDEGEGLITSEKNTWKLEQGYIYMIPSFTLCNLYCASFMSQYFIHFFENSPDGISLFYQNRTISKLKASETDAEHFKRILQLNPYRKINRSDNPNVYEKNIFYKEYEQLNNNQSESHFMETQGILFQLVAKFIGSEDFVHMDTHNIPTRIVDMIGYIQLHLNERLSVRELANMVNMHPDYFSRLFLRLTGQRPLDYIHERRIERIQYRLVTSSLLLSEIAEETGFESVPHMVKVFKKITNLTPGKYRAQNLNIS